MAITHVLVLAGLVIVESAVLSGKGLYCRDPDTGKFHTVNSTWLSSSFCGNYTCKLRKRNLTETEYTPIRQINITNIHNNTAHEENVQINDTNNNIVLENDKENITVTIEERTEPEIESVIHKEEHNKVSDKTNEVSKTKDDYLTEKEIKSIAEILHTVKKSDLDAIVEIYNLAQEIYNEMDKANEGTVDNAVNTIVDEKYNPYDKKSYWYDPLSYKNRDMDFQGSNAVPTKDLPTFVSYAQDVGKMPYYYPISEYQRSSSYIQQPTITTPKTPCKPKEYRQENIARDNLHLIKPSYLLPYPFAYINHFNYSSYANTYPQYYNNPYWNGYRHQYQPYYNAYMTQIPRAELINPNLHEEVAGIEQKPVEEDMLGKVLLKTKEKLLPAWKTEQLSSQVLDDVRANIDTSRLIKAFPFRKKVKLEKVGKLIKLDELTRRRRSQDAEVVENVVVQEEKDEDYETFLEKTTCQTEPVPGYFRYGNLSQPFPECCPQMINKGT